MPPLFPCQRHPCSDHPGARRATPPHLRRGVLWPSSLLIQEGWRVERRGGYLRWLSALGHSSAASKAPPFQIRSEKPWPGFTPLQKELTSSCRADDLHFQSG